MGYVGGEYILFVSESEYRDGLSSQIVARVIMLVQEEMKKV